MLADIAAMSERDRMSLLTRILDMSVPLSAEVKKFISRRSSGIRVISAKHLTQLQSLIFATVYLCQHFPTDLSIDFLYALLVNMLFMGYFSSSSNSSSTISTTAASKLLEFGDKSAEVGPLMKKLLPLRFAKRKNNAQSSSSSRNWLSTGKIKILSALQGAIVELSPADMKFFEKGLENENLLSHLVPRLSNRLPLCDNRRRRGTSVH